MSTKPRLFVGSSAESLDTAKCIQENLERAAEVTVWTQDVFAPSKTTLAALAKMAETSDFAIFVFAPNDKLVLRGEDYSAVRDNVIFELGMFAGAIGIDRSFIILPHSAKNLRLPTDLHGITLDNYDSERTDGNMTAALGPCCNRISRAMHNIGLRDRSNGLTSPLAVANDSIIQSVNSTPNSLELNSLIDSLEKKWPDTDINPLGISLIQREMDLIKRDPDINRAYAIDHFDPTIWAAPRAYYWLALQCRRFLKENYIQEQHQWDIVFSSEVLDAINRSVANIESIPGPRPQGGGGASVTHFDDTPVTTRPHRSDGGVPRFEAARILIWEPKWMELPFVQHLLRMHSAFNVPLFFLDKHEVQKRNLSLDIEYLLLCSKVHTRNLDARDLDGSEWPRSPGGPRPIKETELDKPLDHFLRLLEFKTILFAADAYKIIRSNRWEEYSRLVNS